METNESIKNPFIVTTPEDMSADDTFNLFVDVFSDFPKILEEGHSFLHGPRGSGKSMMFRYLKPDCQLLRYKTTLANLPFYSIYIRVKNTELLLTEMQRLDGKHATFILNEHFMVMHFAIVSLGTLLKDCSLVDTNNKENIQSVSSLFETFHNLLMNCGYDVQHTKTGNFSSIIETLEAMVSICNRLYGQVKSYCRTIAFNDQIVPYSYPLCSYLDFLFPLLKEIKNLPFMPIGAIYLLIDDADNLSVSQTKILNSWVFTRSSSDVSLKISTQQNYLTYATPTGALIETPHDYSEVNISTVYTSSNKHKYRDRIYAITDKRLKLAKIASSPEEFFPTNSKQEDKINEISENLKERWHNNEGRGFRASDDALRYARPDYIKSLAGPSKSSSTYSYSGFDQLIHLSSGIARYFLDNAKNMYSKVQSLSDHDKAICSIPPNIQNEIVREDAHFFLFDDLAKKNENEGRTEDDEKISHLFNLINGLGGMFRIILLSERSERKVFSFAISDKTSSLVKETISLGVKYGYLQLSTIGRKEKQIGGRTRLFILNRRLAPIYNLDPTGFAGYQFVTNKFIEDLILNTDTALRKFGHKFNSQEHNKQLSLFGED
jgi:hypothetical protein